MWRFVVLLTLALSPLTAHADAFDPESRVSRFLSQLTGPFAALNLKDSWEELALERESGDSYSRFKNLLDRQGPVKSFKLIKKREGAGARLVFLTYRIQPKKGQGITAKFTFIQRLKDPYIAYELETSP